MMTDLIKMQVMQRPAAEMIQCNMLIYIFNTYVNLNQYSTISCPVNQVHVL